MLNLLPYDTRYQNISTHLQKSKRVFRLVFQQLQEKLVLQAEIPPELNKPYSEIRSLNSTHSCHTKPDKALPVPVFITFP
jgi:hypothetical protein